MEGFLLSRAAYMRIVDEYPDFRFYIQVVVRALAYRGKDDP